MVAHGRFGWLAVTFVMLVESVACGAHPLAPPATLGQPKPAAEVALAPPTSTVVPTSVASTPPVGPDTSPRLSADGPWHLVDAAPGVRAPGLVYELVPGLWAWLPVDEDVRRGVVWTFTASDREVVEAYLQARLTIVRAAMPTPFIDDDPGWGRWFLDGGAAFRAMVRERQRRGETYVLDRGVVLRPTVLGEGRTDDTAIVFDCVLDGGLWVRPDGSPGEGTRRGTYPTGVATRLQRVAGEWRIEHLAEQAEACE